MQEKWVEIPEFTNHLVSDQGRIFNSVTDHIKALNVNQQGIAVAKFTLDRVQVSRSVALIVANAFLPPFASSQELTYPFDTPIHMNGDRLDCRVDNLAWRPRWFAVKYHRQFKDPVFTNWGPVMDGDTEEIFDSVWDAAVHFGLEANVVYDSIANKRRTFPTSQSFVDVRYLAKEGELQEDLDI